MNTKSKAIGYINNPDGNANIEKKKQELFYLAPDFPTSIVHDANTIAAQSSRIAELEARVKELEAGLGQVINRCEKAFKDTGYPAFFHDGTLSTARALLETNDRR